MVFLGEHRKKMPFIILAEPGNADTEADVMTGEGLIAFYVNPSQRANVNPRQQCGYKNGYAGLREFS